MKLNGKRVLVIGGGSGIGLAAARCAAAEGAEVVLAGRSDARLAAARGTFSNSDAVELHPVDLADEPSVARLFQDLAPLDHIVVTAVDAAYELVARAEVRDFRRVIDSKLLGALLVAKHGAPKLAHRGSLTLTSGIAAERPAPRGAVVAAVNGALNSLVRALALELAPTRVNAVSPGWVDTPVWDAVAGPAKHEVHARMAARLPIGRIGQPQEIADAILFLLANEFMTGTVLRVDGGHPLV